MCSYCCRCSISSAQHSAWHITGAPMTGVDGRHIILGNKAGALGDSPAEKPRDDVMRLRRSAMPCPRCLRTGRKTAGPEQSPAGTEGAPRVCSEADPGPDCKGLWRDLGEWVLGSIREPVGRSQTIWVVFAPLRGQRRVPSLPQTHAPPSHQALLPSPLMLLSATGKQSQTEILSLAGCKAVQLSPSRGRGDWRRRVSLPAAAQEEVWPR